MYYSVHFNFIVIETVCLCVVLLWSVLAKLIDWISFANSQTIWTYQESEFGLIRLVWHIFNHIIHFFSQVLRVQIMCFIIYFYISFYFFLFFSLFSLPFLQYFCVSCWSRCICDAGTCFRVSMCMYVCMWVNCRRHSGIHQGRNDKKISKNMRIGFGMCNHFDRFVW